MKNTPLTIEQAINLLVISGKVVLKTMGVTDHEIIYINNGDQISLDPLGEFGVVGFNCKTKMTLVGKIGPFSDHNEHWEVPIETFSEEIICDHIIPTIYGEIMTCYELWK